MHAVTVCVNCDDYLAITLPRNRLWFSTFHVLTDHDDWRTLAATGRIGAVGHRLSAFHCGGCFNKWAGLSAWGGWASLDGWAMVLDCDILLPSSPAGVELEPGVLYWARRRQGYYGRLDEPLETLPIIEDDPAQGYVQLFHLSDPRLTEKPWWPVERTVGGDSAFAARWKGRLCCLPFDVIHIGPLAVDWYGRVSGRLDGLQTEPRPEAASRMLADLEGRRRWPNFLHDVNRMGRLQYLRGLVE